MAGVRWSGVTSWYRVRYLDGTEVDVQVRIPDAVRWERNNPGRSLLTGQTITAMMECVWYALRREHLSDVSDFDAWSSSVDDFAQMETPDVGDPTTQDQSAG